VQDVESPHLRKMRLQRERRARRGDGASRFDQGVIVGEAECYACAKVVRLKFVDGSGWIRYACHASAEGGVCRGSDRAVAAAVRSHGWDVTEGAVAAEGPRESGARPPIGEALFDAAIGRHAEREVRRPLERY
jgi:hypothetical protein